MANSKSVQFTRAETEALLNMMHHCGSGAVHAMQLSENDRERIRQVHSSLPIAARVKTVLSLNDKIWSLWASTHPEEGPFK